MKLFKRSFPFYRQLDSQDCSFACLKMISRYYGVQLSNTNPVFAGSNLYKQGITIPDFVKTAGNLGYRALPVKLDFEQMVQNVPLPAVFFWNQNHFLVVHKISNGKVHVADPAYSRTVYGKKEFIKGWTQDKNEGIVVVLEPTAELAQHHDETKNKTSLRYVTQYMKKHKVQLFMIALTLLISSCIELVLPFFTQKMLDKGVALKNVSFIYLVLAAQLTVFISRIGLEFYRSWLFIHISSRISLSIISDFLAKLMRLPIKFFGTKNIGDLTQRIQDHRRIESFMSKDLIQTVFSMFSILIYAAVLSYFNVNIFLIVLATTSLELFWIFRFIKKLRTLDQKTFSLQANDQNKIYEMINAMQEIKLNNLEESKRQEWQKVQNTIYLNNIDKLKVNQQYESYRFISFLRTILVVFVSALAVMNGTLTVGGMLAIMFILGGVNGPITQLINFVLQYNLVKVSFERLNEIHNRPDEENHDNGAGLDEIRDITIRQLSFSYDNTNNILRDISLNIPSGKTTAIVGVSGSGKTTLLKLLLKFYKPQQGTISVGEYCLEKLNNTLWRNKCGVILQDSFIFSSSVSYNIALNDHPDAEKLDKAIQLANIGEFLTKLPLGLNTIIGTEGMNISQGQKQRVLIARAIYKNPDYLFFDEATNSLDAKNERLIVENINEYFKNKTMIVVAHRLSTVKNADQIIVLDNGAIIEQGDHEQLIKAKGKYFELIQNQLELGL